MIVLVHGYVGRLVLGVDPGRHGAMAWVSLDDRELIAVADIPLAPLSIGETEAVDPAALDDYRNRWPIEAVAIERAQYVSGQGGTSSFNYGANWGALRAGLARDARVIDIASQKWKRDLGLSPDKRESLAAAAVRWPKQAGMVMTRKMDDGRAEAALLADYAIERHVGMFT